ncbi:MAG: iron-containing alcohol dehydrogenase family protein [Promethearchaeota archaeon]
MLDKRDKEIREEAMEIFKNWPRTKIIFGKGVIKETGKYALEFCKNDEKKALIVIGGGSVKKNGILDSLTESLKNNGIKWDIFEGVEPNPSKETIENIAKKYNSDKYDVTIGLGGGSVMDAAKAALILTTLKTDDLTPFFGVNKVSEKLDRISPCICIPTTSGTSSEITRYSNVTVKELGVKKLISDIAIHPHYAIVDPLTTISCSKNLTLVAGLDTLTHAMEGYLNTVQDPGNNDINQRALLSIELVFKWLKTAANDPKNEDAREMMAIASLLGGTVIGGERFKGTGGPHMNSFSWASFMEHGKATAIMLPYYIVYYGKNEKVKQKLEPIADLLKIKKEGDIGRNVAEALLKWYKDMEFPTKLSEVDGWEDKYIDKAIKDASQNAMKLEAMPNPVPLDKVDEVLRPILMAARDGDLSKIS